MLTLDFRETTTDHNKNDVMKMPGVDEVPGAASAPVASAVPLAAAPLASAATASETASTLSSAPVCNSSLPPECAAETANTATPQPQLLSASASTAAARKRKRHVSEQRVCAECLQAITDQFVLQVSGSCWHARCLRCCVCQAALDHEPSCFMRDHQVYCRADYIKSFGAKCARCCRGISSSDWVRKARDQVYHLACFACDACHRQLSSGEEFALHENRVLCKTHYMETLDLGSTDSDECGDSEGFHKNKAKRVRTTFTEEQLQVLQANFQMDSNPDGQDLERIALTTGLSKRVTQVWFQNSRARQKKHMHTGKIKTPMHHGAPPLHRDDANGAYSRLNVHLYSFQSQQASSKTPSSASSVVSNVLQPLYSTSADHGSEASSMDELSQDSMLHCMRGEV